MGRVVGAVLLGILVLAGIAVGGAYAFDQRIRSEVEAQVSATLKQSVPFTVLPTVEIAGEPIAWHLLTRRFPSVRVVGAEAATPIEEQRTLQLLDVDVTLTDVTVSDTTIDARHLRGTARLSWAEVSELAGVAIADAGQGRVAASGSAAVFGMTVTATLEGVPALDTNAQTVTIADPQVDVAGVRIPAQATRALVDTLVKPFHVPLPYGLKLEGVTPGPDGLRVAVTGRDVRFPRS